VNRDDVWVGYLPAHRRIVKTRADGSTFLIKNVTKPVETERGKWRLSVGVLAKHFGGYDVGDLVALPSTAPDETCRWIGIDIDAHDGEQFDPVANGRAAHYWQDKLTSLGFEHPLLTQSNGEGGFHLLAILDGPVPCAWMHAYAKNLVSDFKQVGLSELPEVLPKSPRLTGKRCGTSMRLPGRHHTKEHWSRVWDGENWLEGNAAIDVILRTRPSPADLIPEPKPEPKRVPTFRTPRTIGDGRLSEKTVALSCLDHIPNAGCHYDQWVGVGMSLHSADDSAETFSAWDQWSRQSSKYTEGETEKKWRSFRQGGGLSVGYVVKLARQYGYDVFAEARRAREQIVISGRRARC
jgi:hypothetical protein